MLCAGVSRNVTSPEGLQPFGADACLAVRDVAPAPLHLPPERKKVETLLAEALKTIHPESPSTGRPARRACGGTRPPASEPEHDRTLDRVSHAAGSRFRRPHCGLRSLWAESPPRGAPLKCAPASAPPDGLKKNVSKLSRHPTRAARREHAPTDTFSKSVPVIFLRARENCFDSRSPDARRAGKPCSGKRTGAPSINECGVKRRV